MFRTRHKAKHKCEIWIVLTDTQVAIVFFRPGAAEFKMNIP